MTGMRTLTAGVIAVTALIAGGCSGHGAPVDAGSDLMSCESADAYSFLPAIGDYLRRSEATVFVGAFVVPNGPLGSAAHFADAIIGRLQSNCPGVSIYQSDPTSGSATVGSTCQGFSGSVAWSVRETQPLEVDYGWSGAEKDGVPLPNGQGTAVPTPDWTFSTRPSQPPFVCTEGFLWLSGDMDFLLDPDGKGFAGRPAQGVTTFHKRFADCYPDNGGAGATVSYGPGYMGHCGSAFGSATMDSTTASTGQVQFTSGNIGSGGPSRDYSCTPVAAQLPPYGHCPAAP